MSAPALKGDHRLPLYQRLADSLREDLRAGRWRPGDRVPSENELAVDTGLAAGTVRQALAKLVDEGLLERRHGKGTFVRRPSFDQSLFRFFRFRSIDGTKPVPVSRIRACAIAIPSRYVREKLQMKEEGRAITIRRLRIIDDQPVLSEEIWLPEDRFSALMDLDLREAGDLLYPIYDTECGQIVASAEEVLTVGTADDDVQESLGLEAAAPVIVIERLARSYDGTPLEWRRSWGRAEQFSYHTEIR